MVLQTDKARHPTSTHMPSWTGLSRPSTHTAQAVALQPCREARDGVGGRDKPGHDGIGICVSFSANVRCICMATSAGGDARGPKGSREHWLRPALDFP